MNGAATFDSRRLIPDRWIALGELVLVVSLLEAELWSLRGWAPPWFNVAVYAALIGTMVLSVRRRQAGDPGDGEARTGVGGAWLEAMTSCALLAGVLMAAAGRLGDSNETFEFLFLRKPPSKLLVWVVGKFLSALAQQLALQWFLWPVCREIAGNRTVGMVLAASLFGFLHLPSPTLVAITLVAGLAWVGLYRRSGQLAPLIASHMVLATLAHGGLPERLTYDMRVGMTAEADRPRFAALEDPKARLINRRLKEHRSDLRHFASLEYYQAQGGTDPGFIRGLFRDILGRTATDSDVAFWRDQPFANRRDQIPSILLASDELAAIEARRTAISGIRIRR